MHNLRQLLIAFLLIAFAVPGNAQDNSKDSNYVRLYKQYFELYDKTGEEAEKQFFSVSGELMDYFLKREDIDGYYQVRLNEVFYENNHKRAFSAVQKANTLLENMKEEGVNLYYLVYQALGSIYQSRGNYRMAQKYYTDAYDSTEPTDSFARMNIYFRMANLKMFYQPKDAYEWIKKSEELSEGHSSYYQIYCVLKAIIEFSLDDKEAFLQTYKDYFSNRETNKNLDDNGLYTMNVLHNAFNGKYQAALEQLDKPTSDLSELERMSLRSQVLQRQNRYDLALATALKAAYVIDSLNSDMLFDNLNVLNAEVGVAKMEAKVAKDRVVWMGVVIVLGLIIIASLVFWIFARRKTRQVLIEKNRQLKMALDMAEESDKMKSSFLKNITHEIRTPLNAINGFTQLLNNPEFELEDEEKQELTQNINDNVENITHIVDEILQLSEKESNSLYTKIEEVSCNDLLQKCYDNYKDETSIGVDMHFNTSLGTNFTLRTNESGMRQIVNQLLDNATKFTETGNITLHAELDPDNNAVSISVTDTGVGIKPELQDLVFQQFFKGDSFKQGIGLGLNVSKMIAQKLGGDLVLDKRYTKGCRFVLTLPIYR